jgi:hypothetical protein
VRTDELSASELVVTSAFSKMVASTITYPHEVVRSYMHVTGVCRGAGSRARGGVDSHGLRVSRVRSYMHVTGVCRGAGRGAGAWAAGRGLYLLGLRVSRVGSLQVEG